MGAVEAQLIFADSRVFGKRVARPNSLLDG